MNLVCVNMAHYNLNAQLKISNDRLSLAFCVYLNWFSKKWGIGLGGWRDGLVIVFTYFDVMYSNCMFTENCMFQNLVSSLPRKVKILVNSYHIFG